MSRQPLKSLMLWIVSIGLTAPMVGWVQSEPTTAKSSGAPVPPSTSDHCATLAGSALESGVIESASYVPRDGALGGQGVAASFKAKTGFCRIHAHLHPVPASDIQIELWLPDDWNGKLLGTGGAGYNGGITGAAVVLGNAIGKGYAAFATDAGHEAAEGAAWAAGHPEQVVDWAHRANHEAAVFSKAVVASFFGKAQSRAYFEGCSNGGRDALMEARRYPEDYDGIIAGAPAADWTGMTTSFVWNYKAIYQTPGASGLKSKMKLVTDAVLAKCDALDGVKDGVLENPRQCAFDPAELQCKAKNGPNCLTHPEVAALRKIYKGPRLKNGQAVFSGVPVGSEGIPENKNGWIDDSSGGTAAFGTEFFRWMVYQDANWSPSKFHLDSDYAEAVKKMGPLVDANDPDLSAFTRHGGKLILYHGWDDARVEPDATIKYYDAVSKRLGPVADQIRLYMVPGMAHCFLGPGPNKFDMLGHLDRWVSDGEAPDRIIATKYDNDIQALIGLPAKPVKTRPLCPWPEIARYDGKGPVDDSASFSCGAPGIAPHKH